MPYAVVISTIFAIISPIIGITAVIKGSFQPQRMTRFLILLVSFLFVGTLFSQGDHNGIYIASAQLIGSLIIFLLAIKHGMGGTNRLDFVVLALALLSIIVWKTTNNPTLGLIMSIITDLIGFIPTLIKTWKLPHTEDWRFYMSDVLASFFSLLSITMFDPKTIIFPLYILLINTTSVIMILTRRNCLRSL